MVNALDLSADTIAKELDARPGGLDAVIIGLKLGATLLPCLGQVPNSEFLKEAENLVAALTLAVAEARAENTIPRGVPIN